MGCLRSVETPDSVDSAALACNELAATKRISRQIHLYFARNRLPPLNLCSENAYHRQTPAEFGEIQGVSWEGSLEAVLVGNPEEKNPEESVQGERTTQFIQLLTLHQPQIYAYIATLLFGDSAAADVLQDTNLHLWAQAERYDFERPFLPWAFGFARQRVMAHRKTCSRSRLVFCESTLDLLSDHYQKASDTLDHRLGALQNCLKRLSAAQSDLIRERYVAKTPVQTIAVRMDDSAHNISSRLHRIRKILANCVEHVLAAGEP
jgi:RNA polymerase sigma-70 factor, ECF subfamily